MTSFRRWGWNMCQYGVVSKKARIQRTKHRNGGQQHKRERQLSAQRRLGGRSRRANTAPFRRVEAQKNIKKMKSREGHMEQTKSILRWEADADWQIDIVR